MYRIKPFIASLMSLTLVSVLAAEDKVPSYVKDIKPFLAKYCLECHNDKKARNDFDVSTHKVLMTTGISGPVIVAGKPDDSLLVGMIERKAKPYMPPPKSKQPKAEEIALMRAWVAAGARDDSGSVAIEVPNVKPRAALAAPVAAVAYSPDGKVLAAGGHKEVILLDVATGAVVGKIGQQQPRVNAIAFSRDGRRFAVASGAPGTRGEVRLYAVPSHALEHTLAAHADVIHDLAFSPDGKLLATCSYDRLVKLWDAATGKEVRTLKDHSDAVYAVAFRPDGTLLASVAADRAVKVWDVAAGTRLYTLGEATDWLYAVAWAPNGQHLAAGGVDRSIRVWHASAEGGRIVHSVFAHDGPVTRLVYAQDGSQLYSLSEDRTAKSWDTERMIEEKVYPRQPETPLALAVRPDHRQLAIGRYDGALVLLDEATGKEQSQPLPVKPKPPQLDKVAPAAGPRGRSIRVTLEGKELEGVTELTVTAPGATATLLPDSRKPGSVQADLVFPATTPAGVYQVSAKSPGGQSGQQAFTVDWYPQRAEIEPNGSPSTGQKVTLPATIAGSLGKAGEVDYYQVEGRAGQQLGVQVVAAAKLDPVLTLTDISGRVLAEGRAVLGFTFPAAGVHAVGIRDVEYRGGPDMTYRLHLGDIPVVTAVFPAGLQQGTEIDVAVEGVHLGAVKSVKVKAPANASPGTKLPVSVTTPLGAALGNPTVIVGEFPEATSGTTLSVPGTGNGHITVTGEADTWRVPAKKGQRLVIEVNARRLGSPLDSMIEVFDAAGKPVPRATLRSVAKTYTTFRDHDSANSGMRIETWSELAINDYLLVGPELVRIRALPKNPDDDCQFFTERGQRLGFLDTTPTHHSLGTPMYKVTLHPPGTTFPPNGMPVIELPYRNDDGGPGYGKDSRLFFDPPADGDYQVRVSDARGLGGPGYIYRVTVRPPRPSFSISFTPTAPTVSKGGAIPVTVTADRIDGFDGPIDVRLENLPPGLGAPATQVLSEDTSTAFALWADATAVVPMGAKPLKLVARAMVASQEIVREVNGEAPKVIEPGDIVTRTEQSEATVKPGGEVRLTVHIERRNGFKGRVPLEVRGLPHGVRVLDIGLNGILITEKVTSRTFVIYAEPWVRPTDHPIVVLARREGKNTEHAARSVLLRVAGP